MDRLWLLDVQCPARVGVTQSQRDKRQTVLLDLALDADAREAGERDDFRLAVDYWSVENSVREAVESKRWQLLEALAEHVASLVLLQQKAVSAVWVRARKKPRANKNRKEVAVELLRRRAGAPASEPQTGDAVLVKGVDCRVRVGVPEDEREKPQWIGLDLELRADYSQAAKKDDFRLAVDTESVANLARETAESQPWALVEAVAERVAAVVLGQERRAESVTVRARKSPFVMPKTREVAVEITRRRKP